MRKKFFLVALILFLLTLSGCNIKSFFTTTEWKTGTKATSLTTNNNGSGEDTNSNKTSSNTTSHTHQIVYQIVEDANCTEDGYAKTYCPVCGKTIEDHITIAAKGHLWDEIIGNEPTCTDAGFTAHSTCERCGLTVNAQVLPALGHNFQYQSGFTPAEDNTESHGKCTYSCERCHKKCYADLVTNYKAAYGYQELSKVAGKGVIYASLYKWYYDTALDFLNNEREISVWTYQTGEVDPETHEAVEETAFEINRKEIKGMGLSIQEAAAVYHTFLFDCPEFFFLKSGYVQLARGSEVFFVLECNEEFKEYSYRQLCQKTIKEMCIEFGSVICNEEDDLKRIKLIHDFIINRINYGYQADGVTPLDNAEAHCVIGVSAYSNGAGTAVCEAYSKTFLYFTRMYEINAIIVHGQGHAWNMVEYNGDWYGLDATWDDQPEYNNGIYYGYFMKNEADFKEDSNGMHEPYGSDFTLSLGYQFPIPEFASVSYKVSILGKITLDN